MGRPLKQTVDYFPHEAGASDGTTLTIIQSKFGNDGYAFWFKLLERLASSEGHFIDCRNPARWQFLLAKTQVSAETGQKILDLLAELEAIDPKLWHEKIIWSGNLVANVAIVYKNRRATLPQKPSSNSQKPSTVAVSTDTNSPGDLVSTGQKRHSIVEYSIVEYIKDDVKKSPLLENTKRVFELLDKKRGYRPTTKRKAEAASIIRMLKSGKYSPEQIISAWERLKEDKFWQGKELFMMSVESQIGAIIKDGQTGTHQQRPPGKVPTHYTNPDALRHD